MKTCINCPGSSDHNTADCPLMRAPAHIEDGEEVEVVGYRVSMPGEPELGTWLDEEAEEEPQIQHHEPLMTVAQHQRIVAALSAPPAAGVLEQMSQEARSTLVGMVEYCLNARVCMGMDEGFKSFEPEVEHDFVKELRAFAEGAPTPPAAGVPEGWQPMETAPTDGTLLRLLVEFEDHPIEDGAGPFATVGTNYRDNTGEDAWQIVGWCWEQDRFIDGVGTPIGWLPMLAAPTPPASEQQRAVVMPDAEWIDPVALCSCGPAYDAGWRDGVSEAKRLNAHLAKGKGV